MADKYLCTVLVATDSKCCSDLRFGLIESGSEAPQIANEWRMWKGAGMQRISGMEKMLQKI